MTETLSDRHRMAGSQFTMTDTNSDILSEVLITERRELGLPLSQQLLRLNNVTKTECCTNAPTAVLLGNAIVSRMLSTLPNQSGLLSTIRGLTTCRPTDIECLRILRKDLVTVVPAARESFADYNRQQDSHEWLMCLLDGLERQMPTTLLRDSFVSMFQVNLEVTHQCTRAGHGKRKREVEMDLSVPVQHRDTEEPFHSLSQCLKSYFSDETVEMDCQTCGCKQARRSTQVTADPDVLVIHLKRFDRGNQRLGHAIEFKPELPGKCDERKYVLTGVVLHSGQSAESGHYRSVIRCHETDRLFLLDDDRPPHQLPDNKKVLQGMYKDVYILLFSKEDKLQQQVFLTNTMNNRLMAELGIVGDHRTVGPVHCDDTVSFTAGQGGEPVQCDPAMQEGIRLSLLQNVQASDRSEATVSAVRPPRNTKRKSRETTPGTPSTPRKATMHTVGSGKPRYRKAGKEQVGPVAFAQPQSCPPPVQIRSDQSESVSADCGTGLRQSKAAAEKEARSSQADNVEVESAASNRDLPSPGNVPLAADRRDVTAADRCVR